MDLGELKQNWDILAERDPMWAIVSVPSMKGRKWDPEAFFQSGQAGIDDILSQIAAANFSLHRGAALDFGCGLGRLTQAIAKHFERTFGVDISPTMIAEAARYNRFGDACTYILNDSPDLHRFPDETFDFIYSDAVLQHIPPDASRAYIAEFVRVLKPGGLLVFQVPSKLRPAPSDATTHPAQPAATLQPHRWTRILARIRNLFLRLKPAEGQAKENLVASSETHGESHDTSADLEKLIDMHGIPREEVCDLLQQRGATVFNVQEENWSGPEWDNFRYWVTKQS